MNLTTSLLVCGKKLTRFCGSERICEPLEKVKNIHGHEGGARGAARGYFLFLKSLPASMSVTYSKPASMSLAQSSTVRFILLVVWSDFHSSSNVRSQNLQIAFGRRFVTTGRMNLVLGFFYDTFQCPTV